MIGATLLNRYRLDAQLGQGGMGVVYRAHDVLLERPVAVKLVHEARLGTVGRAQLLREARAAAQLNHPNIVSVFDASEADGTAFIVMELVEGQSLFERALLPLPTVLDIARQVCAALEHAHRRGLVHRDLKLENVLLTAEGVVKLTDFGLARASASRATGEGGWLGTVFYLSPELAQGQPVDGRADLYSLGVLLYELTLGRPPFTGDDPLLIIAQHLHAAPAPPRTLRPELPEALEAIILRLLAKNPADRFASAGEVAHALAHVFGEATSTTTRPAPGRHNLPAHLSSFVGRDKELADLQRLLAESRLLTLTGPGGAGKTRLTLRAAELALHTFSDGVWFVDLAAVADPNLVAQSVASALRVREEAGYPLVRALADYAQTRNLLLILDNCEHLLDACAVLVETLLRHAPGLKVIVTSREALSIGGERVYRLPSLSTPDPLHPPAAAELLRYEAARLFVERAQAAQPGFQVTADNVRAIAQICHRLDGLPLALELAAARLRALNIEQIAERLDDRFRLLTGGSRTALPRQQTLRALIDWSYDLLTERERLLLRRLSVFVNGWTLEAAEAVAADPEQLDAGDILETLTHLVDKSLVQVEEHRDRARYQMLATIRQYAGEALLDSGEVPAVRGRHLAFYGRLAEAAAPELRRAAQVDWLALLDLEHDNLRAALQWGLSRGEAAPSQRLAGALARFWYFRGYWNEGRDWLRRALAVSQPEPESEPALRARSNAARLSALLGAAWLADDDGSEESLYTESLALARQVGDVWSVSVSLRGLSTRASYEGEVERAAPLSQESLSGFRTIGDEWGIALVLYDQGWQHFSRGDEKQAEALWEESQQRFQAVGDRWGRGVVLGTLGYLIRSQGNYTRALKLTQASLDAFRELGDRAGIAVSLTRLGNIAFRRGDYLEAISLLDESLTLRREWGDVLDTVTAKWLLALIACFRGEYPRAVSLLEECLTLAANAERGSLISITQTYLGWVHYYRGESERAEQVWQAWLGPLTELDEIATRSYMLVGLALAACRRGDQAQGLRLAEEALAASRSAGDRRYLAIALYGLGRVRLAQGAVAEARAALRESLLYRKKMGDRQGLAESLEGLAEATTSVDAEVSRAESAARWLGAADVLRTTIGAPIPAVDQANYVQQTTALRALLGEARCAAAWAEGRALSIDQTVAAALLATAPEEPGR